MPEQASPMAIAVAAQPTASRRTLTDGRVRNRRIESLLGMSGSWISVVLILCACLFIGAYVLLEGMGIVTLRFLVSEPNPSALSAHEGGILTPLIGTILLTGIGIALAYPAARSALSGVNTEGMGREMARRRAQGEKPQE